MKNVILNWLDNRGADLIKRKKELRQMLAPNQILVDRGSFEKEIKLIDAKIEENRITHHALRELWQ